MERFALSATNALLNATRLAEDVKSKYMKLLEYLCEDENMASNDFFGTMRRFMDEFDRSLEAVEREEKAKVSKSRVSSFSAWLAGPLGL